MNEMRRLINLVESIERGEILEEGVKEWLQGAIAAIAIAGSPAMADSIAHKLDDMANEISTNMTDEKFAGFMAGDRVTDKIMKEKGMSMEMKAKVLTILKSNKPRIEIAKELDAYAETLANPNADPAMYAQLEALKAKTVASYQAGEISQDDGLELMREISQAMDKYDK